MFAELEKEREQISRNPGQTVTYEKQMESYEVLKTRERNRSQGGNTGQCRFVITQI